MKNLCLTCGKTIVPIGLARSNGKGHDDWDGRQYHKKCWKLKRELAEFHERYAAILNKSLESK